MRRRLRRLFSLMLVLVMAVSLMPTSVVRAEGDDTPILQIQVEIGMEAGYQSQDADTFTYEGGTMQVALESGTIDWTTIGGVQGFRVLAGTKVTFTLTPSEGYTPSLYAAGSEVVLQQQEDGTWLYSMQATGNMNYQAQFTGDDDQGTYFGVTRSTEDVFRVGDTMKFQVNPATEGDDLSRYTFKWEITTEGGSRYIGLTPSADGHSCEVKALKAYTVPEGEENDGIEIKITLQKNGKDTEFVCTENVYVEPPIYTVSFQNADGSAYVLRDENGNPLEDWSAISEYMEGEGAYLPEEQIENYKWKTWRIYEVSGDQEKKIAEYPVVKGHEQKVTSNLVIRQASYALNLKAAGEDPDAIVDMDNGWLHTEPSNAKYEFVGWFMADAQGEPVGDALWKTMNVDLHEADTFTIEKDTTLIAKYREAKLEPYKNIEIRVLNMGGEDKTGEFVNGYGEEGSLLTQLSATEQNGIVTIKIDPFTRDNMYKLVGWTAVLPGIDQKTGRLETNDIISAVDGTFTVAEPSDTMTIYVVYEFIADRAGLWEPLLDDGEDLQSIDLDETAAETYYSDATVSFWNEDGKNYMHMSLDPIEELGLEGLEDAVFVGWYTHDVDEDPSMDVEPVSTDREYVHEISWDENIAIHPVFRKKIHATAVTVDRTEAALYIGDTFTLKAAVTPEDTDDQEAEWSTSDSKVATVKDGVVTAVGAGEAKITVTIDGKTAVCTVTVRNRYVGVSGVALDQAALRMKKGAAVTLKASVAPDNATDKTITWTTSNAAIATVDAGGNVKAVAAGTATITAKAGDKSASCTITVYQTGLVRRGNVTYYYDNNGNIVRNRMLRINNQYYYFASNGAMQTNKLVRIGRYYYYCAANGMIVRNKLQRIGRYYYYFAANGVMVQNRLTRVGRYYYYFASNGVMMQNRLIRIGRYYYYAAANGVILQNRVARIGGYTYYFASNGVMVQNRLVRIGRYYYYFDAYGRMRTGWVTIGGQRYYFNAQGAFVRRG